MEAVVAALSLALFVGSMLLWAAIIRRLALRQPLVELEPREPVPWTGFDVVLLAMVMLFFEMLALGIVSSAGGPISSDTVASDVAAGEAAISPARLLAASFARIAWIVFAALYLIFKSGAYVEDLGFDTSRLGNDARLGGLIFVAAIVPVFAVQWFFVYGLGMPSEHPLVKLSQEQPSTTILALATLMAVVVAPLFEEFAFRVVLQGWLESHQARLRQRLGGDGQDKPGFAPLVITSVLFALLHFGYGPDPFALFVFSLFLGYAYRQTHRIVPPLVVHACLNGWTMVNLWAMYFGGK
ncbi:MAG: CPBP family intramembrane glutamic endopeptidase [Pirellulales bacterium]